jgi:hypothetical protein
VGHAAAHLLTDLAEVTGLRPRPCRGPHPHRQGHRLRRGAPPCEPPRLRQQAAAIHEGLRAGQLRHHGPIQATYAAIVTSQVQIITILNVEIAELGEVVADQLGRHRDADRYLSLPGLGPILGTRICGNFGQRPTPLPRWQSA